MATATNHSESKTSTLAGRAARKLWREVSRPIRRMSRPANGAQTVSPTIGFAPPPPASAFLTGSGAGMAGFHPQQATVEPEAIAFIQRLVRDSRHHSGPIIEIGTLLGITTTNMALAKSPEQKIITVDNYCWNPWALPPDVHASLTGTVLYYLIKTGQVEQVRMDKNEFFRTYRGPAPAMVFLDAVHDYPETKKDIQWSRQVGAKMIAGHDYCDEFPGVKQVVDEFGGPREQCSSVWLLK
jgi:hypothetical protein